MDYKETVMNDEEIRTSIVQKSIFWLPVNPETVEERKVVCLLRHTAEAQAEITWEARQNEVDEAEQRGIEKVVDKINPQIEAFIQSPKMPDELALVIKVWWQAFLKEVEK